MSPSVQYGGDEVGALVLDIGSSTVRAGYAGEDAPKCLFPTAFATIPSSDPSRPPTYVHGNSVHFYRPHAIVSSFVADGIVTDWNAAGRALEHAFQDRMRVKTLEEFPLMASEPSWNTKENKEKMCELAFETWQTPAFYSVDKAVMSAFAAGKGSALIVDVGEELTTVTPVYDGFVLRKAIQKQPVGGALLSEVLLSTLKSQNLPVTPHYLVKTKEAVEPNQPANAQLREDRLPNPADPNAPTTPSYHRLEEMRLMHELKDSACEVMTPSWDDNAVNQKASRAFEFPDGFNTYLGTVRLSTPEIIFNPQRFLPAEFKNRQITPSASTIPSHPFSALQPLAGLIRNTLVQVDPDLQATLLANVVVTGGTTLIPGFIDRLQAELGIVAPGMKIKIHAAASAAERTHSSWLGGSILASLGTFHQLWIGKDEYQEVGNFLLEDPSKRAFVTVDGKPVPVFLTRNDGQRRIIGSIKSAPGQSFRVHLVGRWYRTNQELLWDGAEDSGRRLQNRKNKPGRPFQFAKLLTTDNPAAACSDLSKIDEQNCIRIVYNSIKDIKKKKVKKDKNASQRSRTKKEDPLHKHESSWKKLGAVDERSDKGKFGLTSFGALPHKAPLNPAAEVDSTEPEYKATYSIVDGSEIETPLPTPNCDNSDAGSFVETDDDSDGDDFSPQELGRTLHQNPQLYALIKAAAKGGTVNLPSLTPEPAASAAAGQSPSNIPITQRRSAYVQQEMPEKDNDDPVAGGSGVGAAGATQGSEVWRDIDYALSMVVHLRDGTA
ncbi:actin-related protein Arp4p [Rhodotorula toruloides]|uniref:Actin-related protein Arp4p n=1 Tax=Rhodotorula toruloides TaxID=5286 RepID=A0A511KH79_RHOTO|nr:actin-related protein Arp4p [Rhodotorula toruloides]